MTIKQLRQINNMSQRDFAKRMGVTQAAVYLWEKNDVVLSQKNQDVLDEVFGIKRGLKRATSFDIGI